MFGPGGSFLCGGGRDEWRDERTVCQRGGCMVVPGAVVSPGHTRRLSLFLEGCLGFGGSGLYV